MKTARNVGALIKELRKASGLKQSHVAERLNVERSSISKIESGVPALSQDVIKKIAFLFRINPDFIDGRTDNAFLPESFLRLKMRHNIDIVGGSSMPLPIILNTQKLAIVYLVNKSKVEYVLAKDELNSIFVMEIVFNLKLDDAIARILNGPGVDRENIAMRVLPISDALSEKLRDIDVVKKDDVLYCFAGQRRQTSYLEKMLIDLVRNKTEIKDIIPFLKGMGLK
ncbi:MAG: helix-turn-helix domain-containing protein [Thermodesulfovibrionales bacterium]